MSVPIPLHPGHDLLFSLVLFCFVLNSSQSSGREVKSHCGFICISLMTNVIEHLFHVFLGHLHIFGEMSI